jgi:hypothetical protein
MKSSVGRCCRALLLACVCLAVAVAVAQFRAGLQGTVTDSSGAVVNGAKVSVTNQETGKMIETQSNDNGFYTVTGLPPGLYSVNVSLAGFKTSLTKDLDVSAEAVKGLNVTLQAGGASEQVQVNGAAVPEIQTEDANLTGTISEQQVQALPQFRGDPFELLRVTPGVFGLGARDSGGNSANLPNYAGTGGSVFGIYQTENAVQVSANGQRVDANGYTLDGVSTNSQRHGGATVVTPNQESVQEVKVEVNSYNAENGHNAGAVVETISKSGTNNLHGSYGFRLHSPGLNATQRWNGPTGTPQRDPQLIRNYFGSVGGPIIKNRLFAFFSFDHMRTSGHNRSQSWEETPDFVSSLTSGTIAGQLFAIKGAGFTDPKPVAPPPVGPGDPAGQSPACKDLGLLDIGADPVNGNCHAIGTNMADVGSRTGNLGQIVGNLGGGLDGVADVQLIEYSGKPDTINATQFNGRMDFQATNKDLIAFSVYKSPFLKSFQPGGWVDGRQYNVFNTDAQHDAATALWTRTINSTMINEARFNVTHWFFDELKGNPQAPFGLPTDAVGFGNKQLTAGFFGGPGIFHEATYSFRDTLSKVHKSHVLKFGFGFDREQNNNTNAWGAHPGYHFTNLWSFANDAPDSQNTSTFDPKTGNITSFKKYVRVSDYALFGQDTWKVRPNLTLTLGLRWDYTSPLGEKNNQLSRVVLGQGANTLLDMKVLQGGDFSQPDRNNFGPQFGFAWSPSKFNNKMVWRGGFGVAYTKIGEQRILNAAGNPPSFVATGLSSDPANSHCCLIYAVSSKGTFAFDGYPANPVVVQNFGANGLPLPSSPFYGRPDVNGPVQNLKTPYTYHYSLETQYDLGREWVTSLSYQGSQSRKMQRTINYRLFGFAVPQAPTDLCTPDPGNPTKCDLVGAVNITRSDTNSSYNALLARITHNFSHGVELNANYRWSKSIDFCSYDENCGDQQSFPIDQRFERGPSDFDVTHSFTSYVTYELPLFKGRHDWLYTLAGGWKLGTIISLNSGFPWTPVFSFNGATCDNLKLNGISCTSRPGAYLGGAGSDYSTDSFKKTGGNFPKGSLAYFVPPPPGVTLPGIGRNSFRGPRYTGIDLSFGKRFILPKMPLLGESAGIEIKANAFNIFNKLNLTPFGFNSGSTNIGTADPVGGVAPTANASFGQAQSALSGRTIEMQARFSF